uniref:Uncharacterized protein n=1 Tax=Cacopsylla melanoneura TaxID=428564 RepID=A0A8D8U2L0_9HEMI
MCFKCFILIHRILFQVISVNLYSSGFDVNFCFSPFCCITFGLFLYYRVIENREPFRTIYLKHVFVSFLFFNRLRKTLNLSNNPLNTPEVAISQQGPQLGGAVYF